MSSWYESPTIRSLDTETTGVDPHTARILQAAVVDIHPGARPEITQWLLDPGCEVPEEAAAVHGFTRDRILSTVGGEGMAVRVDQGSAPLQMPVDSALFEIAMHVAQAMGREIPLVVANAAYDLTLLEAELTRNDIDTLASRPAGVRGVVDPMVIEKQYDPYRKTCYSKPTHGTICDRENGVHVCGGCRGSSRGFDCSHGTGRRGCGVTDKKLASLCLHYGVPLVGAHDAAADALGAARLAVKLGGLWGQIKRWKLETLHKNQVDWRRVQMDGLRAYFDKNGIEHDGCDGAWPLLPTPVTAGVSA